MIRLADAHCVEVLRRDLQEDRAQFKRWPSWKHAQCPLKATSASSQALCNSLSQVHSSAIVSLPSLDSRIIACIVSTYGPGIMSLSMEALAEDLPPTAYDIPAARPHATTEQLA